MNKVIEIAANALNALSILLAGCNSVHTWWTGIAGDFTARPISETGVDRLFLTACAVLPMTLLVMLLAARRLNHLRVATQLRV